MKLPRNELNGWIVASISSPGNTNTGWLEPMRWCSTRFDNNWRYVGEGVFEFRRAEDHTMFLLRWS